MKKELYETKALGAVTEEELRDVYELYGSIEENIREWLRESDSTFASEQMDELRDVIKFATDAWDNVYATPAIDAVDCGLMAEAVRKSIFGYPSTIEDALCKLERYSEGAQRVYYDIPRHFEKAIDEQMELVCEAYEKCIGADLEWWMDATSDELFENYFLNDPDEWMEQCDELIADIEIDTPIEQRVFVEDGLMFGGLFEARIRKDSFKEFWQIRRLPDAPDGKAEIIAQRGTRAEAFDLLWRLVMGYDASWAYRVA